MDGQRSKAWFEKRHKRWTASVIKGLMSEGRVVAKKDGGDGELKYKWGDKAKTALFAKFYERLTDVLAKEIEPTKAMQRGIDLEPLAIERFGELYMEYTCIDSEDLVDTGFVLFPDDDGTKEWEDGYKGENASAGASPDQVLSKDGIYISGIETKARGEEATHSHAYGVFDTSHADWWQVVAQAHSIGAKYWYYLNFDDEKPSPWDIQVKEVPIPPMHVKKMCQKIKDADLLIEGFMERCEFIKGMMPHEANVILTGIREEIQDLKEKW